VNTASVSSIALEYPAALLAHGTSFGLKATLKDSVGNVLPERKITWTSSDPSVAPVGGSGLSAIIGGAAAGTATITAAIEGKSATSVVTVVAIASIVAGPKVSCAITTDGSLYCAGENIGGSAQLLAPTVKFSAVGSNGQGPGGTAQSCALAIDGSVYCWGANLNGQLGVGDFNDRTTPTRISSDIRFASISVGRGHACGLTTGGDAWCWGDGAFGELGNGRTANATVPQQVAGGLKFSQIEAGHGTTCGLTTSARAYCWGRNDLGQLGQGPESSGNIGDQIPIPVPVGAPLASMDMKQIVTRGPKTCGLTADGRAYCWGNNTVHELGTTTTVTCYGGKPCSSIPLPVQTFATFVSLSASQFATCGIMTQGGTQCWGMDFQNLFGGAPVLGCSTAGALYGCTTVPVQGAEGMVTLSISLGTSCGMKSDGVGYCWGGNEFGQRGWGGSSPDPTPQPFTIAVTAAH
jgi:alpha-tubulin suppressor-like RCC1 family protein